MIVFKAENKRDFYRLFIRMQSVKYNFNPREIAIASEFLFFRAYYITNPLFLTDMEEVDGKLTEVKTSMPIFEQLKDRRTLYQILKNLNMSMSVLRKHVKGLKDKGFFDVEDIAKEFITDGISVAFNLKK